VIPTLPFWLRQRQVKVEPVNETTMKLAAPQLPAYEAAIQPAPDAGGWYGVLYGPPDAGGQKALIAQAQQAVSAEADAWEVAFELYRRHVIV
jgi:threonyl-tRNA synthetase